MQLGEGEEKITEIFLKKGGDVANLSILTNRRLVVIWRNAEESYPLSKITSVKTIFNRSWLMLILGVIFALSSLMAFGESGPGMLVALPIGAGLAYLGWRGKTQLSITQMGGNKYYPVKGKSTELMAFADAVSSRLS